MMQNMQQQHGHPSPQPDQKVPVSHAQTDGVAEWDEMVAQRRALVSADPEAATAADMTIRQRLEKSSHAMEGGGLMLPLSEHPKSSTLTAQGSSTSHHLAAQFDGPGDSDEDTKNIKTEKWNDDDDEDAINSDLDDPDEEDVEEVGEDSNQGQIMLCTYDKVQRVKAKWKCILKDGVLTTGGKEYLFHKATGEFECSEWPGLLEHIQQKLDFIAHHDFPTPSIPLPAPPPASVSEDVIRQDPPRQDSQIDNAAQKSSPPSNASRPLPVPTASSNQREASIAAPAGTLPPQLLTLLAAIQSNLRDSFPDAPPHTAQRLAELVLRPRRHYRNLASYLRALDRVVSVSSPTTVFPLPSTTSSNNGNYLNGTITPGSTGDDPDDTLGGAALTPIPWLRDQVAPGTAERMVGSDLRRESTSVIDGPNGVGSVETVTVAINGNARQQGNSVTQGELIRQEQEAGVVPVPIARSTAPPPTESKTEAVSEEDVIPHARGPEVIGMEDMGPQSSSAGFNVEAALGRPGEGEAPASKKSPENTQAKEPEAVDDKAEDKEKGHENEVEKEREKDADGDVELVDADGNTEADERKADSVGQNVGSDAADGTRTIKPSSRWNPPEDLTLDSVDNINRNLFFLEPFPLFKTYGHEAKSSLLGGQPISRSYQPYSGGYHHRQGISPGPAGGGQFTKIMYKPNSTWTWAFVGVSFVQAAIVLGFEAYAFAKFQTSLKGDWGEEKLTSRPTRTIPTFLALYIFGFVYQLILVYDALRLKNTIQVIGLCIYNVGLLVYAAVQMDQIHQAVEELSGRNNIDAAVWDIEKPYLIAIPCVIAFGTVLLAIIAWKLYDEFAWTIYKHISADLRMKRRYLTFQIYIALLKFDFFFFLGFTIQFVVVVVNQHNSEFYLTIAAIPVTIIILLLAGFFTRKENAPGMLAVIVLYFAGLAYFLFKLVRMYQPIRRIDYDPVRRPLTTFAVITVILIILTIVNACMCMANFGRGLKPHIAGRKLESEEEKFANGGMGSEMANYNYGHGYGPSPGMVGGSRMTID
ncbi:MAG: hypothetical protein Q9174_004999 [Haloplaca sp. 1 TL-2023]